MIRLGVNIDHVATVRNARGVAYPDPITAAAMAELGGADLITVHLREDRRHIRDRDVRLLRESLNIPMNLEMAATDEMLEIAMSTQPDAVTLVPEKREEQTTEGGLDMQRHKERLHDFVSRLKSAGIFVSMFIEPDSEAIELSSLVGADAVELHTGDFCHKFAEAKSTKERFQLIEPIDSAAQQASQFGLQVHVGHGLHYQNAAWMQHVTACEEANIGHSIVARAIFVGLEQAVREMKMLLNQRDFKPRL